MSEVNRSVDALGVFLTGGVSNRDPDLSLGGTVSATRVRGLGPIIDTPIPAIRFDNVFPACGEGTATLAVDSNGDLVFTPPGGAAGTPVAIAAGESKIVSGVDANKAIRVFRETVLPMLGTSVQTFVDVLNGVLGMKNITDAQRTAGVTTYRAFMLKAQGVLGVLDIRLWMPPVSGAQAVYSLGLETPVGDTIQTIADELTAPAAVVFSTPTAEGAALVIPSVGVGQFQGVWLRKTFPVGTVALQEDFQLAMKYEGA